MKDQVGGGKSKKCGVLNQDGDWVGGGEDRTHVCTRKGKRGIMFE